MAENTQTAQTPEELLEQAMSVIATQKEALKKLQADYEQVSADMKKVVEVFASIFGKVESGELSLSNILTAAPKLARGIDPSFVTILSKYHHAG